LILPFFVIGVTHQKVYFLGISFEKLLSKTIVSDKRMNKKIIEPVEGLGHG
jgi:hypothetical protein